MKKWNVRAAQTLKEKVVNTWPVKLSVDYNQCQRTDLYTNKVIFIWGHMTHRNLMSPPIQQSSSFIIYGVKLISRGFSEDVRSSGAGDWSVSRSEKKTPFKRMTHY